MSRYLLIRLKKISLMFLFPIIVELGILIYENVVKKEKANISMYNGLWYVATVAIIVFVTVYQIIKNYYLGHDSLWQIFPYSKEGLEFIDIFFYILGTIIYGCTYQYAQATASNQKFYISMYIPEKLVSLIAFYLLIMAMCVLFKNVQCPKIGEGCIIISSLIIIISQISIFWKLNQKIVNHFLLGLSDACETKNLIYINTLPYVFFDVTKRQIATLINTSYLLNGCLIIFCLLFILISIKFRRMNYIDLLG